MALRLVSGVRWAHLHSALCTSQAAATVTQTDDSHRATRAIVDGLSTPALNSLMAPSRSGISAACPKTRAVRMGSWSRETAGDPGHAVFESVFCAGRTEHRWARGSGVIDGSERPSIQS